MVENSLFPYRVGVFALGLIFTLAAGCCLNKSTTCSFNDPDACASGCLPAVSQLQIDEPTRSCEKDPVSVSPDEIDPNGEVQYWAVSLEQAIEFALQHSEVLRDLGGTVLRSPSSITTVQDPAITYTNPLLGEEAALSFFDTTLSARATWDKIDRMFNNQFLGDNGLLEQDLGNYEVELNKRSATGTIMSLRHTNDYDFNNSAGNQFGNPSTSWTSIVEAEVRQPLLQGGGILFNRIAGPSDRPGIINGVLVARIRTDVSLVDFETGLRNLVSNVENAYWDLYFSYRDLDAKTKARDKALEAWQAVYAKKMAGDQGGEADKEGQAREQYWRFESEVIDSLNGRLVESTRNDNGSGGGTFRNVPGVRVAERRLRLAMGMPITDTSLIRPADEPPEAPVQYDWSTVVHQSVELRPELRKQRWRIKQRELELAANRNFLLPRLDAVGRYRFRGFGEKLMSSGDRRFNDSLGDLADGDFQEWQLGVEFNVPLGFRRAHAAVRNSELQIARERAILEEQKRTVMYGLSNAVADVRRAYEVVMAQFNRYSAAETQVGAIRTSYQEGKAPLDLLLEAQRRLVDAETRFHQARVDYALALKNVQFEKGTLLEYYNIKLAEGPSTRAAYIDAAKRERLKSGTIDYVCRDKTISCGPAKRGILEAPLSTPVELGDSSAEISQDDTPLDAVEQPIDAEWIDAEWIDAERTDAERTEETLTDDSLTEETPLTERAEEAPREIPTPEEVQPETDQDTSPRIVPQPDTDAQHRIQREELRRAQRDATSLQQLAGVPVPDGLELPYNVPATSPSALVVQTPSKPRDNRPQHERQQQFVSKDQVSTYAADTSKVVTTSGNNKTFRPRNSPPETKLVRPNPKAKIQSKVDPIWIPDNPGPPAAAGEHRKKTPQKVVNSNRKLDRTVESGELGGQIAAVAPKRADVTGQVLRAPTTRHDDVPVEVSLDDRKPDGGKSPSSWAVFGK